MGIGASVGVKTAVAAASKEELSKVLTDLPGGDKDKLLGALGKDAGAAPPSEKPTLYYFPIAARGEVTRMIAAIGGVEIENCLTDGSDLDKKSFGSPSSMPLLKHGDLKLSQSHAIVSYMLGIAPKYKDISAACKAKDLQFNAIMDDIMAEGTKPFFGKDPNAKELVGKTLDKWFTVLEEIVPSKGFVNGLDFPTGADFVLVILMKGYTPYQGLYNIAEADPFAKCPKVKAIADATLAIPEVKAYVEASKSMGNNPFGFP